MVAGPGTYSPAGVAAAKPVRFRRCPATVMPPTHCREDEPGRLRCADERQPSEEGRFAVETAEPTSSATSGAGWSTRLSSDGTAASLYVTRPPPRLEKIAPESRSNSSTVVVVSGSTQVTCSFVSVASGSAFCNAQFEARIAIIQPCFTLKSIVTFAELRVTFLG